MTQRDTGTAAREGARAGLTLLLALLAAALVLALTATRSPAQTAEGPPVY